MKYNLSEINEVIRNRRTVSPSDFSSRKVHREIIENILTNGTWAPTHGMTQPWRFKVFHGEGMKKLADFIPGLYQRFAPEEKFSQKKFEKITGWMNSVSAVVFICMERDPNGKIPEIEEVEAVACAVQNMHLTCTAYGIGAKWSSPGYVYSDEMKSFLALGEEDKCLGMFYLGYPEIEWPKSHRKPLEYVTEWIDQ